MYAQDLVTLYRYEGISSVEKEIEKKFPKIKEKENEI